jgi:mono/diheme cytochrome c family protein
MTLNWRMLAGALVVVTAHAHGADVKAGKVTADASCIQCHDADDWDGEDAASLESLIRDIVAGKVKHRQKIELSPAEIANIAAYWSESSR